MTRRPFQFSLAALFWLTLAVAGCGPGVNKVEQIRQGAEDVDRHAKEIQREAQVEHAPE